MGREEARKPRRERREGEHSGGAVEKRPPGEAEHAADVAAGREPIDARTGQPVEPPEHGRLERPDAGDRGKDREGLADTADREPHDHSS